MIISKMISHFSKIKSFDHLPPDLLITLSLQHQNFTTYPSLISHLKVSNILKTDVIEKILLSLPRNFFLEDSSLNNENKNFNQIKPFQIGFSQAMTDIAVHCHCLEAIYRHIPQENHLKILDIGTGSGFMAFALYYLAQEFTNNSDNFVLGVDIYNEFIEKCRKLKNKLEIENNNPMKLEFQSVCLQDLLNREKEKYDIINVGFAINENLFDKIRNNLLKEQNSICLAPVNNKKEGQEEKQDLVLSCKNGPPCLTIMKTFFSEIIDPENKEFYKYFIENGESKLEENEEEKKRIKEEKAKKIQELEEKFRNLVKASPKKLSLKELNENEELKCILNEIKILKKSLERF